MQKLLKQSAFKSGTRRQAEQAVAQNLGRALLGRRTLQQNVLAQLSRRQEHAQMQTLAVQQLPSLLSPSQQQGQKPVVQTRLATLQQTSVKLL
jgi:hypothetical protein